MCGSPMEQRAQEQINALKEFWTMSDMAGWIKEKEGRFSKGPGISVYLYREKWILHPISHHTQKLTADRSKSQIQKEKPYTCQ